MKIINTQLCAKIARSLSANKKWILSLYEISSGSDKYLRCPLFKCRADPFVFIYNNIYYVIFEEFNIFIRKGYICLGTFDRVKEKLVDIKKIYTPRHHCSFPQVVVHPDTSEVLLLLEEHELHQVNLYELDPTTGNVKLRKTLLREQAVDPVLFFKDGTWYLFVSVCGGVNNFNNNLQLFTSNCLLSEEFHPHPCSPLSTENCFGARMAGPIIAQGCELYRPGQDCRSVYGGAVVLHKITKIDPVYYYEEVAEVLTPPRHAEGRHTLCKAGDLHFSDIKYTTLNPIIVVFRLIIIAYQRGYKRFFSK